MNEINQEKPLSCHLISEMGVGATWFILEYNGFFYDRCPDTIKSFTVVNENY